MSAADGTPIDSSVVNVAALGDRVWFSVGKGNLSIYICTWAGLNLTSCTTSYADGLWQGSGEASGDLVIDAVHQRAYFADVNSSRVLSCANIATMTDCTVQIDSTTTPAVHLPNGLALKDGYLYVTTFDANLIRCPVGSAGLDRSQCQSILSAALSTIEWDPPTGRFYLLTVAPPGVRVCDQALTSCANFNAEGLPLTGLERINSAAIINNMLLIPSWGVSPTDAASSGIIVCTNAASVSGCTMQLVGAGMVAGPVAIAVAPLA